MVCPGLVGWLSDADRCSSCCLSALLLSVRSAAPPGCACLPGGSGGEEEAAQETSAFFSLVGVCLLPHSWLLGSKGRESLPFSDSAAEAGQEKRAGKRRWVSHLPCSQHLLVRRNSPAHSYLGPQNVVFIERKISIAGGVAVSGHLFLSPSPTP